MTGFISFAWWFLVIALVANFLLRKNEKFVRMTLDEQGNVIKVEEADEG